MRFIYTDEAGTSANEPVTVVVGLIVHADTQWTPAVAKISEAMTKVPSQFQKAFIFHAKSIWGSQEYRPAWSKEDRAAFLMQMMAIPRMTGIATAYGLFFRDGEIREDIDLSNMTREQYQHTQAFATCMASADQYITDFAAPNEIATVVAENIPEMHKNLKEATLQLRAGILNVSNAHLTQKFVNDSSSAQRPINLSIRRIVDDIHFSPRESSPLLWLADAVAFGLRRYFSEQSLGLEFAKAIMGQDTIPWRRLKDCACGYMCNDEPKQQPFSAFSQ